MYVCVVCVSTKNGEFGNRKGFGNWKILARILKGIINLISWRKKVVQRKNTYLCASSHTYTHMYIHAQIFVVPVVGKKFCCQMSSDRFTYFTFFFFFFLFLYEVHFFSINFFYVFYNDGTVPYKKKNFEQFGKMNSVGTPRLLLTCNPPSPLSRSLPSLYAHSFLQALSLSPAPLCHVISLPLSFIIM